MNKEYFDKSKAELKTEKEKNNKQLIISGERNRVVSANKFEYKFGVTSLFSMGAYALLMILSAILISSLGASVITNILPGISYPTVILGSSLIMGTIGRILFDKKNKIKEKLKSLSVAKTEIEKLEEEVNYQIEIEKLKNRNKVIDESINVLESNQLILSKYDLKDKNKSQTAEEAKKSVEELSAIIEEQYKELDVCTVQNVLYNRFLSERRKSVTQSNVILFLTAATLLPFGTIMLIPGESAVMTLFMTFAPTVVGAIGSGVYVLKTNKNNKKIFNKLNSQLGENSLEKNIIKTNEIDSMIKKQVRNISLTKVQLQESKRYLDTYVTEEDKKKEILEQNLYKSEITREDILNNSNKYNECDDRVCMKQFYNDEEYERHIESSLNSTLLSEDEKGPKLVKKINLNNKNN